MEVYDYFTGYGFCGLRLRRAFEKRGNKKPKLREVKATKRVKKEKRILVKMKREAWILKDRKWKERIIRQAVEDEELEKVEKASPQNPKYIISLFLA